MHEKSVKSFYDGFLDKRMLNYFIYGNERINAAVAFINSRIDGTGKVLDFGCGIGAVSDHLSKTFPNLEILGIDASKCNIAFAEAAYARPRASFREHSDLSLSSLRAHMQDVLNSATVDSILMIDVIEHIPAAEREKLLTNLRSIISEGGDLFVTYPTPWYQEKLRKDNPDELQIIDEAIDADVFLMEARRAGWYLRDIQTADVWTENQYFHAHLRASAPTRKRQASTLGLVERLRGFAKHKLLVPIRRRALKKILANVPGKELS